MSALSVQQPHPDACPACGGAEHTGIERYQWTEDGIQITVQFRCWSPDCRQEWSQRYRLVREPIMEVS